LAERVWCYDCPDHGSRIKLPEGKKPPRSIRCSWCGRRAKFVGGPPTLGIVQVTPDIPEHWNMSLNEPVRSRRHLRDLQKIHGTHDYEGVNGANLRQVFGPGGELHSVSR